MVPGISGDHMLVFVLERFMLQDKYMALVVSIPLPVPTEQHGHFEKNEAACYLKNLKPHH